MAAATPAATARAFISGGTLRRLSVGRRTRSINIHSGDSGAAAYWDIYIPVGEGDGGGGGGVAVRIDRTASTFDHSRPTAPPLFPPLVSRRAGSFPSEKERWMIKAALMDVFFLSCSNYGGVSFMLLLLLSSLSRLTGSG